MPSANMVRPLPDQKSDQVTSPIKDMRTAPDFNTIDAEGRTIRLSDYAGKKNVILVFNRGFG